MAETVPITFTPNRRTFLRGALLLAGGMVVGTACSSGNEQQPAASPHTTKTHKTNAPSVPKLPVEGYVENWLQDADYAKMQKEIKSGSLKKLYAAFAIPNAASGVLFDPVKPSMAAFIDSQKGAEVSLSLGGYGDDSAPGNVPSSRKAVLEGWKAGLDNPEAFAADVVNYRKQLASELGRPYQEIGLDVDFEYPTTQQTTALNGLMHVLRRTTEGPLTMVVPSRANLEGYDLPTLANVADRLNVMTYANGDDYGPQDVVRDMSRFADIIGDNEKLAVGCSADRKEDPMLWAPTAMSAIRQGLAAADITPAAAFVWPTNGLDSSQINALAG